MKSKIIGGIFLIIGTSIGGGMLALPIATAAGGFWHSTLLFFGAWALTVVAAFFILEVNLWLPAGANMVSMAKATLGRFGAAVTWLSYLLLLYSLLAAYTAGGGDLLQNILVYMHVPVPLWIGNVSFALLLGIVLFYGVRTVDWVNRGFMSVKLIAYIALSLLLLPTVNFALLQGGQARLLAGAVMVVITSFGYATVIPTLRCYFNSNVKALRLTIAVGSLIPLMCYLLWDLVVQGNILAVGDHGLIAMTHSDHAVSDLTVQLGAQVSGRWVSELAHIFTSICITTSFLGVSLCLSDFIADGLRIKKQGIGNWVIIALTLGPPLLIVLIDPKLFIQGLKYAGVFCVVLLMLLPALMVWSGRYRRQMVGGEGYQVMGGAALVVIEIVLSAVLLGYGIFEVW